MTTPLEAFADILQAMPELAGYTLARGEWVEERTSAAARYLTLSQSSARAPLLDAVRFIAVQILIVGKRNESEISKVEEAANALPSLIRAAAVCWPVAALRIVTDVAGPSFSEQGRPVYELTVEMMYQTEEA